MIRKNRTEIKGLQCANGEKNNYFGDECNKLVLSHFMEDLFFLFTELRLLLMIWPDVNVKETLLIRVELD